MFVSQLVYVWLVALPVLALWLVALPSPAAPVLRLLPARVLSAAARAPFHLPTMVSKPTAPCYLCTEAPPEAAGRCKPCNAMMSRARTTCKTIGKWDEFLEATKENKSSFYKNGHDKMGKELKGLIEETISESIV